MSEHDELIEQNIAFDAAWEAPGGNQPCPQCGERMDTGNRCPACEPEQYPEQYPEPPRAGEGADNG